MKTRVNQDFRQKKVTKFVLNTLVIFIIGSCASNSTYSVEGEVLMHEAELAPLSKIEKSFQDSLRNLGIGIVIERTYIGRAGKEYAKYRLIIDSTQIVVNSTNIDSIEKFRSSLVNELYSNVLSDSVIFCIDRISTEIKDLRYDGVGNKDFFYLKDYLKESLETINGFKVEKTNGGKLKRINISGRNY